MAWLRNTVLARRIGVTTGGTSYNLRVLAEHGLVEEVAERARGRERWWRQDLRFPIWSHQDPELRTAVERLNQLWLSKGLETFARFQAARDEMGPWSDALPYSRGSVQLSLPELMVFFEEYLALLRKYQRPEEEV